MAQSLVGASFYPKTSDAAGIQAAVIAAFEYGGGVVKLQAGDYLLNNSIYLKDKVTLEGVGVKTVLKKNAVAIASITKAAAINDRKIFVDKAAQFKKGDGVSIFSKSLIRYNVFVTEVIECGKDFLILKDPLPNQIDLKSAPKIQNVFPIIYFKECKEAQTLSLTIDGNCAQNPTIDSWWDSGIAVNKSENILIKAVTIKKSAADAISLNASDYVTIEDVIIEAPMRMGMHIGSGSLYTTVKNTKIYQAGINNKNKGDFKDGIFLCFGAKYGRYEDNLIKGCKGHGISIGRWDSENNFYNNTSTENSIGLVFRPDTHECFSLYFTNNKFVNNKEWDLQAYQVISNIFIDSWPKKSNIHPSSFDLFYFDKKQNKWLPYIFKK